MTISSNGEISPDETFRIIENGRFMQVATIWDFSMKDFFHSQTIQSLQLREQPLPKQCLNCCWKRPCHGGYYIHRYSKKNGFDNPSILCKGLKMIYSKITAFLLQNGYPMIDLKENLKIG